MSELVPIFVSVPTEHIVILKSILESYEDLGIARTLDAEKGQVVILALGDSALELRGMLDSLQESLKLRYLPTPEDLSGDWLLSEEM
jgi:hypothetical protein